MAHRLRSGSLTAAQTAIALAASNEETRLLLMREFVRGWNDISAEHRAPLITKRPPIIGHPGWDALLAGCVEYLARRDEISVPVWVSRPEGWSPNFFFPVDLPSLRVRGLVDAPVELARRGVMLDIAALEQERTSP